MSETDLQLLTRYARRRAEDAFAEIVRRHVDLVHSAALRQVRAPELAEEVAQAVFMELARKAGQLPSDTVVGAWLYNQTRRRAIDVVRGEAARRLREQTAQELQAMNPTAEHWTEIEPLLDDAMHALDETDRLAVLLRYFHNKPLREVGATLGVTDDAAQKRVNRAIERLREFFAKRGVSVGASGLAVGISANAVQPAPVGLALTIGKTTLAGVGAAGQALTVIKFMATTKAKVSVVTALLATGVIIALFHRPQKSMPRVTDTSFAASPSNVAPGLERSRAGNAAMGIPFMRGVEVQAVPSVEQIVSAKLSQFARSRRDLAHALARRHGVTVSDDVEKFFEAVGEGKWDEIVARFNVINGGDSSAGHSAGRPPGVEYLWPAIIDAYGAAEQTHLWPAQKLLDYGNAILDSLRPGMVYVGGTDSGRWIPSLLNDTSPGERHIVITQNGLADGTYLEYLSLLYDGEMATLTAPEARSIFDEYLADAKKRLDHDQQFPDEPRQVRPGEQISIVDGHVQLSGRDAVFGVNERLLLALMQRNPNLAFALQESQPLRGTYADAVPLGPIMELGVQDAQKAFTQDRATQTIDYWRMTAQRLLTDSEASASAPALDTCSHDVNAAANLLAAHNFNVQAEEAYRLACQLAPSSIEAEIGLWHLLVRTDRRQEADQLWMNFERNFPAQRADFERAIASGSITVDTAPPAPR